jgi:hypothetical protein
MPEALVKYGFNAICFIAIRAGYVFRGGLSARGAGGTFRFSPAWMGRLLLIQFAAFVFLGAQAQPVPEPVRYPINIGWFPKTVSYAPDESNIVVTACTDTWKVTTPQRCTVMRYHIAAQKWETLSAINADANYDDVAYTWDGTGIFAQEYARCEGLPPGNSQREYCSRLVLLDLNGKKLQNLTQEPHNTYAFPSLTQDGKRILYWGVSNQLSAGMGGGAWDVKELDIATQVTVQKTDYQAAFPKTTPRYMPDGKRLMLVAEEYPKRPNDEDFFVNDDKTGRRFRTDYAGRFGANLTVVVDGPRAPIHPFFPVKKNMWLMVRDISRDGTLAVFDRQGVGMCFRFVQEPLRTEECFTRRRSHAPSASISASNKTVAIVSGGDNPSINWSMRLIDVATGGEQTIGMRWLLQKE